MWHSSVPNWRTLKHKKARPQRRTGSGRRRKRRLETANRSLSHGNGFRNDSGGFSTVFVSFSAKTARFMRILWVCWQPSGFPDGTHPSSKRPVPNRVPTSSARRRGAGRPGTPWSAGCAGCENRFVYPVGCSFGGDGGGSQIHAPTRARRNQPAAYHMARWRTGTN